MPQIPLIDEQGFFYDDRDCPAGRSWPGDFRLENGNYQCECSDCGLLFTGYKRRTTCKKCADLYCGMEESEQYDADHPGEKS